MNRPSALNLNSQPPKEVTGDGFETTSASETAWEKIYQGADDFLETVNLDIVSPSPVLSCRPLLRGAIKPIMTRLCHSDSADCKSALLPKKGLGGLDLSKARVNSDAPTEDGFVLKLSNGASALLKRRKNLTLDKANSFPHAF